MSVISQQQRIKYNKLAHLQIKKQQLIIKKLSKWKIFPFTIKNGTIPLTETGYKPNNSNITDFGQYELILNGTTPVIVIWKNSTIIYQKNKGDILDDNKVINKDQFYTKKYKIGDYWNAYLIDDQSGVSFGELSGKTLFKTVSTTRTYTLVMFEEQIKINDYLQFFCVFNDDNENIGGDTGDNQDRQLLYISNVTNYYDPYPGGKFAMQSITFSSINDKLQQSGQTMQGFIQYAGAGSGYAFPTIINGIVSLNKILMRNIGVRYAHRQFYGLEALGAITYFGRPVIQGEKPIQIENKEEFEQKVYASRRLFIAGNNEFSTTDIKNNGGLFAGLNDSITTNSHPETTFYNLMDAQPTGFLNYGDWQEFLAAKQFNMLAEKSFKGILKFTPDKAIRSNGSSTAEAKFFWDSEWNISNLTGTFNVEMSSNFRYKSEDNNAIIGSSTVNYSKIKQKWMSAVLNFNSLIYSSLLQMPYSSEQWLPFALSQIPLIGKMLNALLLGIPIGWVITQNSEQYKKISQLNLFLSSFYTSSMKDIFGKNGLIPLNVFSTKSDFEIGNMLGAKVSTTALLMKLSDRISVYPWDIETGSKLSTREQISSVDLSQVKPLNTDGKKVYICDEETLFLDIESPLTNKDDDMQWNPTPDGISTGNNYAYIIDYIIEQSLGQGDVRHTFYSDNPYTYKGDYNEVSVAQYKFQNQAKFTDNLFNWTTQYKVNMDEYDETEETTFDYPANILPADPSNIAKEIEIIPKINSYSSGELTFKNLFTQDGWNLTYNKDYWINNIKDKIKYLEINFNLKDYLDNTLLVTNINDLKRFYKNITLYIEWNYKINEYNDNTKLLAVFPIKKIITETKNFVKEIDLDNLLYYTNNKENNFNIKEQSNIYKGELYMGPSSPKRRYTYGTNYINVNNNATDNLYTLDNFKYDGYWYYGENETNGSNIKFNFNNYLSLGLKVKEDNTLDWTFQFFPVYFYFILDIVDELKNNYSAFNTDSYTIKLTKIILNPK